MDRARALDLALLLPTLPAFLPAIGLLAVANKRIEGGSAFFIQERLGQDGRRIRVYKLRTMTTEPDPADRTATPFGEWMRQRGLDELPQLLNVLQGDMRLVGPRPLTQADFDRLCARDPGFARRIEVPPGLTGLSQACHAGSFAATVELDTLYVENRSVELDVRVLLRTLYMNAVGKRRGRMDVARLRARVARRAVA
jgi:lipopolysaccharide/colanic/teichoic acid biosynthesis glycosyltransferase